MRTISARKREVRTSERSEREKKKIGLTTQIFIALIVGAILGIVLHVAASDVEFVQNVLINGVFYVVGQGFIRLMQMLVVPLVFCSLICGATAIGDSKTLGKVGIKIIGFYILTTMMAVAVALGIGLLIRPGLGLDMSQVQQVETGIEGGQSVSFAETILNIIPKEPDRCARERRNAPGHRFCADHRHHPCETAG